jgi:hypothetical protein
MVIPIMRRAGLPSGLGIATVGAAPKDDTDEFWWSNIFLTDLYKPLPKARAEYELFRKLQRVQKSTRHSLAQIT